MSNSNFLELVYDSLDKDLKDFNERERSQYGVDILVTEELESRLLNLPSRYLDPFLLYYALSISFEDIEKVLGIKYAKGCTTYAERILAFSQFGSTDTIISENTLKLIANNLLKKFVALHIDISEIPLFSNKYKKWLKNHDISSDKPAIARKTIELPKIAAMIAIIIVGSFTSLYTVNADFREKVNEWFVKTYNGFTEFSLVSDIDSELDLDTQLAYLEKYTPTYLPDGFIIVTEEALYPSVYRNYSDNHGRNILLIATLPDESGIDVDSEDAKPEEYTLNGTIAYKWTSNNNNWVAIQHDGYQFMISSDISFEELEKIITSI